MIYPLRPLPILRSSSPAVQVVLGLGLLLLVSHWGAAFAYRVLTLVRAWLCFAHRLDYGHFHRPVRPPPTRAMVS